MKPLPQLLLAAVLAVALASCGSKSSDSTSSGETTPAADATPPPAADTTVTTSTGPPPGAVSKYDEGPRAADSPVNAALAAEGKTLFTNKGCVTCHGFGKRVIGPDLKGVATRRTAAWMEQQILHPEVMTKEDPIAHALLLEYKVPMTNQKLTPDEAKKVIEYLKQMNE